MSTDPNSTTPTDDWQVFQLDDLIAQVQPGTLSLREFLRTRSLSCSIYHLPTDSQDMSRAHEEDELYLVLKGRACLRVGESAHEVKPGTLMYVHAACDHTFFAIQEDLTVLAFFGASLGPGWTKR